MTQLFKQDRLTAALSAVLLFSTFGVSAPPCPPNAAGELPDVPCGIAIELKHSFWRQSYLKIQGTKDIASRDGIVRIVFDHKAEAVGPGVRVPMENDEGHLENHLAVEELWGTFDAKGLGRFSVSKGLEMAIQNHAKAGLVRVFAALSDEDLKAEVNCSTFIQAAEHTHNGLLPMVFKGKQVAVDSVKNLLVNRMLLVKSRGQKADPSEGVRAPVH